MKVFKRKQNGKPSAAWYCAYAYRGQRYLRRLENANKGRALTEARAMKAQTLLDVIRGNDTAIAAAKLRQAKGPTLAEFFAGYDACGARAGLNARKQNKHALRQFLRECAGRDDAATPMTLVDDALARDWLTKAKQKALLTDDPRAKNTLFASANSRYRQAASLFSKEALDYYATHALSLPGYARFLSAGQANRCKVNKNIHNRYDVPAAAWEHLDPTVTQDKHLFLTIGFELAFGLRANELAQMKWGWLQAGPGYPVLAGTGTFKNGGWRLYVRALAPYYTTLMHRVQAQGWRGAADDYVIPGSGTAPY